MVRFSKLVRFGQNFSIVFDKLLFQLSIILKYVGCGLCKIAKALSNIHAQSSDPSRNTSSSVTAAAATVAASLTLLSRLPSVRVS